MKRFFTLFTTVVVFLSAHAQEHVYYLLPNSRSWNCEQVTDVNDNKTIGDDANQLKWEGFEWTTGNHDYSPERRAYTWFRGTYCDRIPDSYDNVRHVITFEDLLDGRLDADGDLFPNVRVLWVNVDRRMTKTEFDALFPSDIYTKLANFVKAGGNLYLSTFASRLVWLMGRINAEPGFDQNNDIDGGSADWYLRADFGQDNHEHAVYKYVSGYNSTSGNFPMLSGINHTNRNCLWTGDYSAFQTTHTCKVLGSWGHDGNKEFKSEGLVEFYPTGVWKGTIICNGLAACSFAPTNGQIANVQNLTKGILNYLSAGDFTISAKETPVIKEEEDIIVTKPDNLTIRSYSTSNAQIANIHNVGEADPGHIYYNYFGDVTFIVIAEGDGINTPKSVRATCKRTVIGGTPAQYAYVLPYSIQTISDMDYDGDVYNIPDFLSALWFYKHYIEEGRSENYGNGCFINPRNYSSSAAIPSEIQVLWVHNDRVGLESDTYRDDLGCQIDPYEFYFKDALRAFINRGGNVFLSKQATRLVGDLQRLGAGVYPSFGNGGYTDTYAEDWGIKNKFFGALGSETYDLSTHPVYTTPNNLGGNPQLIDAADHTWRTNNNCILFDEKTNNTEDGYLSYQTTQNCRLLGCWDNPGTNYQGGVFAEFYPQSSGQGTIIMLGAAAYQWTCGENTAILENVHANVKNLTQNILEYLTTATVVVTKPDTEIPSTVSNLVIHQGGSVSNTGNIVITNSITYIRPAVGGAAGNELGHWYTFCLPFTPSHCYVEESGTDYEINSVYLSRAAGETESNPLGFGSFYLQTFAPPAGWAYIDGEGKPLEDTPYIIKFLDGSEHSDLAEYFTANPTVRFIGGPQVISGTDNGTGGTPNGDYSYHVNHTLRKLTMNHVYPLNTATNMFEYDYGGPSEIMPFECYIKASTRALAAARPRFAIGRKATQDTNITTSIENPTAESHSPVFVYDVTGRLFHTGDEPRQLPQGIWIVRQGKDSRTIVIP